MANCRVKLMKFYYIYCKVFFKLKIIFISIQMTVLMNKLLDKVVDHFSTKKENSGCHSIEPTMSSMIQKEESTFSALILLLSIEVGKHIVTVLLGMLFLAIYEVIRPERFYSVIGKRLSQQQVAFIRK